MLEIHPVMKLLLSWKIAGYEIKPAFYEIARAKAGLTIEFTASPAIPG